MKNCRNCKYWGKLPSDINTCNLIDNFGENNVNTAYIDIMVHDDTGLCVELKTGANFGCVNHISVEKKI